MDGDGIERRSGRLRSFVIGGVVGASAAIAAARRVSPRRPRSRPTPAGLAAFEDAPCYRETVEREEQLARERRRAPAGQSQPRSRPSSS